MPWRKALFVLLVPLLASCAGVMPVPEPFLPVQEAFVERLRWRDFAGAARYMAPEEGDSFRRRLTALKDLNITDVRLDTVELAPDGRRAVTRSSIEYFLLPSTTVKTFRFDQTWEVVGGDRWQAGSWQVVSPFPLLPGEPLPER